MIMQQFWKSYLFTGEKVLKAPSESKELSKPGKKDMEAPSESKEPSKLRVDSDKKQTPESNTIKVERKESSKKSEKGTEILFSFVEKFNFG